MNRTKITETHLISARERMLAFFKDMCAWEGLCGELMKRVNKGQLSCESVKAEVRPKFESIMETHAAAKAKRTRIAGNTFDFSIPSEYDPTMVTIASITIKGNKIIVQTTQTQHFRNTFVYSLVIENGEVRILDRKELGPDGSLFNLYL